MSPKLGQRMFKLRIQIYLHLPEKLWLSFCDDFHEMRVGTPRYLRSFELRNFRPTQFKKRVKKEIITFLKGAPNFSLRE